MLKETFFKTLCDAGKRALLLGTHSCLLLFFCYCLIFILQEGVGGVGGIE